MFVLGVADSNRESMCDTEPLLQDLKEGFASGRLTFPKSTKGKVERKPMAVARIDAGDAKTIEKFRAIGIEFGLLPQIFIVRDGELHRYDGLFNNFENLFFQMQIMARPIVELKYEDHINEFLNTAEPGLFEIDYKGGLIQQDTFTKNFNGFVQAQGYMTRVVAMFYGKDEYTDEIDALTKVAQRLAVRMNLRIGIVTDKDLINKFRKKNPSYFEELSKSTMIVRRYDGETFKLNLATADTNTYNWFINKSSKKPVDSLKNGAF
jgi:hypothetical protein